MLSTQKIALQDGNGRNAFLWKDKARDQGSDANSMPGDRGDIHHDLHNISNQIIELNREICKNGKANDLYL